jgi:hypothetical protein
MNPGHSVQDANTGLPPRPSGQDDVGRYAATAGNGSTPARSPRSPVPPQASVPQKAVPQKAVPQKAVPQRAVQDIQDIIDKLAAVTQQLRHPHRN